MQPTKAGQIVKFHSPLPDEDPKQLYVILEIHLDVEKPRTLIQALNTGFTYPPTTTVLVEDLIVEEL
jgi:hypothetical protein